MKKRASGQRVDTCICRQTKEIRCEEGKESDTEQPEKGSKNKSSGGKLDTDKQVKKSTRKDKRNHIDNITKKAKGTAGPGNLSELCMVTKNLSNKFQQTHKPAKDNNQITENLTGVDFVNVYSF